MKADNAASASQPFRSLPRDKKTLDFILKKLTENSSPDKFEVLAELLEMHRTSIGFNPLALTKGRLKRFRSAEIKNVLAEMEQKLGVITASIEYRQHLEEATRHQALLDQYSNMVSLLTAPPTKELNDQVDQFIAHLESEDALELLLSFYKQAENHFLSRSRDLEKIVDSYSSLLIRLQIRNNLILNGLQTALVLQQALRMNASQEKLLLHFNSLTVVYNNTTNEAEKVDVLHQIMRVGLCLDKRVKHLADYIKLIAFNIDDIKGEHDKTKIDLLTSAFIYDIKSETAIRINRLNALADKVKAFKDKQSLVNIKNGIALLEAEKNNFTEAIRILNEAEHLLYRNGFKNNAKKEWIEICILRFYIYVSSEKANSVIYDDAAYDSIIQVLRDAFTDHSSLNATISGLKGVKEYLKGNKTQARLLFSTSIEEEKNPPYRYNYLIFKSLLHSLSGSSNNKQLNKTMEELSALEEPFYTTVLTGLLKTV